MAVSTAQEMSGPAAVGRVKGSIFAKVVKSLRARKDEATAKVPEHCRHYLEERILEVSWLPESDYLELMRVLLELLPDPGMDRWEWAGRDAAERDFDGVYRPLIKKGNPGRSLESFPVLWKLRHDTGETQVERTPSGGAVVELSNYVLRAEEIYRSIQGTLWQILHQAGATDIEVERTLSPDARHCRWELRWREADGD